MKIPDDFRRPEPGVLVRSGYEDDVAAWRRLAAATAEEGAASHHGGGRGGLARTGLRDGGEAFVRRYRHGGWLGKVLGEAYVGRPPRPWRELVATEAARRGGVVAPEVLAAIAEPVPGAVLGVPYRGLLVTRALPNRRELGIVLRSAQTDEARAAWVRGAETAIRRLHACGVRHPDLNVANLLVGPSPDDPVAIIDFDRAVTCTSPVAWPGRWMARRRLARSIAKLGLPRWSRAECRRRLAGLLEGEAR